MGLYSKFKIFHFKEKIDSLPSEVGEITPPIYVRIKPTNACNHNCHYCVYKKDGLQLGQDMSIRDQIQKEKMMEIIDDLEEMKVKAVTFSGGGEPFCYPHFLEVIKKISKTSISFASLTNGSRLKGEIAEIFAHRATWLRVSLDGWDDESYAQYRGIKPGEFSKLLKSMESFKKLGGKCYLSTMINVDHNNALHIYETVKQLSDAGVDSIKISACIVSNNRKENNDYHVSIIEEVRKQVQRSKDYLKGDKTELFDAYDLLDERFTKDYNWCPWQQILPVIGADLNVYSCHDKAYNLKEGLLGSIKEQRFKDFWFSDKKQFFKINPSLHCNNYCVANTKNLMILDYLNADKEHISFV